MTKKIPSRRSECVTRVESRMVAEVYNGTKRTSNRAVSHTKQETENETLKNIDPKTENMYKLDKSKRRENRGVVEEKLIKNTKGVLSLYVQSKKETWKKRYGRLLNIEF
jgi:hypothetical protein